MNPLFHDDFSISDSLKFVRKSVLIYETIIEGVSTPELQKEVYGWSGHVRKYGRDYKERLERVGFKVEEIGANDIGNEIARKIGLLGNDFSENYKIHLCRK